MANKFDVIVIGAGNGGLSAAATTAKGGLKTLVLERNNVPGGCATSFRRGRFEFEAALHELADVGTAENPGSVRTYFDRLGADIDWVNEYNTFRVVAAGPNGYDAKMPAGVKAFTDKMESYVPGSRTSMEAVFEFAIKAMNALEYLGGENPDPQVMATEHVDFMRMASHSVDECLTALGMPIEAQRILGTYWWYLGAPTDQLDFLHYAILLHTYVTYGAGMVKGRSHELSLAFEKVIRDNGGDVWYNTTVTELLVKDNQVYGVKIGDEEILANHVISNAMPDCVFGKMMDTKEIPEQEVKLVNARHHGMSYVTIYLGLNKTAEELGIEDYAVFMMNYTDTREQFNHSFDLYENGGYMVNCLNQAIPDCTPEGTSSLFLTVVILGEPWVDVKPEDYKKTKNRIAKSVLEDYEKRMGLSITPYIEEISIATPATYARYLGKPGGRVYAYQNQRWDGMLPRTMARDDEYTVKGLRFAGGHGERTDGYSSAYVSGEIVGMLTINDAKEGK